MTAFGAVNAQVDVSIQYFHYSNNQTFANDTIKTKFIIENIGSEHYHNGDTIFVNAKINGQLFSLDLMSANPTPIVLTGMLHTGDTMQYNPGILLGSQTLNFFPGATTLDICMVVWGVGVASVTSNYGGDVNINNNQTCVTFDPNFSNVKSVNQQGLALSLFPNPANNNITLQCNENSLISKLVITDINGKVVEENYQASNRNQINTEDWNSGLYFYTATLSNGNIGKGKFAVNH